MNFEFIKLNMPEVILINPKHFPDNRGYFMEIFKQSEFAKYGIPQPVQVNMSFSHKGVVRGLHYQIVPKEQGKIVFVPKGKIFDVALDIRKSSKTFGKYVYAELNDENKQILWVPPGFAHGFQALEDSIVIYFVTHNEYSPMHERCINFKYVKWPLEDIVTSEKDSNCPELYKAETFD
ncbi:MAG: dTDP-4-dehydrorhamnose 3,5-epimerase [Nitrososphaeria archaeon]